MSYPGNPSLEREIQERIATTFRQTLELAKQKKGQEAKLGCEFILRMDPQFQPAQRLLAQLQGGGAPAAPAPPAPSRLDALDKLDDLAGLGDLDAMAVAPAPTAPAPGGLAAVLGDLLARRNYKQVLQIAESQKSAIGADPRLGALVEKARAGAESEPFVQGFVDGARRALGQGRRDDAARELDKARSLDPDHPAIAELAAQLEGGGKESGDVLGFEVADDALAFEAEAAARPARPAPSAADLADLQALQAASLSLGAEDEELAALSFDDDVIPPASSEPSGELEGPPSDAIGLDDAESSFGLDAGGETTFGGDEPALSFDADEPAPSADDDLLSFDEPVVSPAAPPPSAAPAGRGRPRIGAPDETGDRVGRLLEEGQAAFDRGEYQSAIDVWSRIFLIEIDNSEASRRIELARARKAELERQAEELFHEAIGKIESRSLDEARETLRRVLELQPAHNTARDYLEQLEAGQVPAVRKKDLGELDELASATGELAGEAGGAAPKKSLEAAVARDRIVAVKRTDRRLVALGAAVLVLVVAGVVFLAQKWDSLFPNAAAPPTSAPQPVSGLDRAKKMQESGNVENAILILERITPDDPLYADAQALMQEWKALVQSPDDAATAPDEGQIQRRSLLLAAAREAHAKGFHLRATNYFDRAAKVAPLESADLELKRGSQTALEPLASEVALFAGGDYEQAIALLWRKREEMPLSKDIEQLIVDSYYNLALRDLQRGDPAGAVQKLEDALDATTDPKELERLLLFARAYSAQPQDLLYRIYVKYLPSR